MAGACSHFSWCAWRSTSAGKRAEGGVGVGDLLARLVRRFGDDHVEGGRLLREGGRPAAGDLALGRQKHKLGHR